MAEEPDVDPFWEPEFAVPEFVEPEFAEPGPDVEPALDAPVFAPVFGVEEFPAEPVAPGMGPQGDVVEDDPGVLFGAIVDGWVVLPGVGGFGDVAPGTVGGFVGVAVLPGGVALPDVFAPVLPEFPAFPAPAAGAVPPAAPPAGALCATAQTAQPRTMERRVSFFADIEKPPALNLFSFLRYAHARHMAEPYSLSFRPPRNCTYRADALERLQHYGTE